MADVRRDLWPEEHSPFGALEPAFAEPSAKCRVVRIHQEPGETHADFELRLAGLKAQQPLDTLFVCVIRECSHGEPPGVL